MSSSMKGKDEKEESKSNWNYDGSEDEWERFDRRIERYLRKKYGTIGEGIWQGSLPVVNELSGPELAAYCEDVWDAVEIQDSTRAKGYWPTTSGFWSRKFQNKWRNRQYVLLKDYIEEHSTGTAEVVIVNYEGDLEKLREHLYKQFGSGSGGDIHTAEAEYEKGMPEKGKLAFPRGIDMRKKLRQLEARRRYFFNMCKPKKRKTYMYCWESKLVRIVLDHVNSDYKDCVARLLDKVSLQKEIMKIHAESRAATAAVRAASVRGSEVGDGDHVEAGDADMDVDGVAIPSEVGDVDAEMVDEVTDLADAHDRSFNNDWLPSWKQLQSALVDEYVKLTKVQETSGKAEKLPLAVFNDGSIRCYGCGEAGHKKGASECRADRSAIHESAPEEYKKRKREWKKKVGGNPPGSSSSGKDTPMASKPCYQFDFGKGVCRYGAKCKFSHDKKGNGNGGGGARNDRTGKFTPSQKKTLTSMVATSVKKLIKTAVEKKGKKRKASEVDDDDDGESLQAMIQSLMLLPVKRTIPRTSASNLLPALTAQLHDVEKTIGVDSDAAISCSMDRRDFPLWIDTSPEACGSIQAPSGIGGDGLKVGGIGPLLCRAESGEYFLDPDGVFLKGDGPKFRILAVQRFKVFGVRFVGCFKDTERDVWQDRRSKHAVDLTEEGPPMKRILVLRTQHIPQLPVTKEVKEMVSDIRKGNRSGMIMKSDFESTTSQVNMKMVSFGLALTTMMIAILFASVSEKFQTTTMIFNEAKVSVEERTRLYVRRFGYCDSAVFTRMSEDKGYGKFPKLVQLNEDSTVKDAAKFQRKPYPRKDVPTKPCWFKGYCDGYGGGSSLGGESYEGAIGGYLFVCPSTGEKIHKLYASHEQFPSALFQFFLEVEIQGYQCHELYVDTYVVNLSQEAEAVAAIFHCKIVPVSNGSPQEVAFVETAHRVIGQRSRAMMLGAPHLPAWCWALADKYAVYTGRYLPQSTRKWLSAYTMSTGKVPNWRVLCLHVFGAPCRYSPPEGPVHKRAAVTMEGYFVGVQHPMALVIRKSDMKLVSVSTKKIHVYESVYCKPLADETPAVDAESFAHAVVQDNENECESEIDEENPKAVYSVKSMRAHEIPTPLSGIPHGFRPPTTLDDAALTESTAPGEGECVPEHRSYSSLDQLTLDIESLKQQAEKSVSDPSIRAKLVAELKKAAAVSSGEVSKGLLKKGKGKQQSAFEIDVNNIKNNKRSVGLKSSSATKSKSGESSSSKKKKSTRKVSVGDLISAQATLFDGDEPGSYSDDFPDDCLGVVTRVWNKGRSVKVRWAGEDTSSDIRAADVQVVKRKLTSENILAVMILEGKQAAYESADKSQWPADFFHALAKSDWRKWVEAVKKEIASWEEFNAYTVIMIEDKTKGASIVPLGELYTRKRDGTYKFRQYLLGNLLKKGKDFSETFSSCVSWDGIRWCASVACATGKQIYGLDAVTGFLQAYEQYDLYAFLPSHGEYSNLPYEELALFREQLLKMVENEGEQGLRVFARNHKRASRVNPRKCYKLNRCIYGAPSANHEFEMLFQEAHVKGCGLTLSEVEPSIYVRILVDADDIVTDWLIVYVWTDDARYFGSDRLRKEYEESVVKKMKVKFLGECVEFVGTDFHQDLERGLCELKAPKYWELAAEKFVDLFPNGMKKRETPLSVADEAIMQQEVTDEEFNECKDFPYRELCGVCSYPAACSKMEMRLSISVCGRYRDKWGRKQSAVLKKVFEYGYATRNTGVIYSRGLDPQGVNVISNFADSAHSLPRSQGCNITIMNGGAISCESKRHTVTASSTCHDELIQFARAANKVVGFRNLMNETGMAPDRPTKVYQDNESAIQIELNRGSLSNRSKHIDRTILTSRNKIEDGEILPVKCDTSEMWADIGTKALPNRQFVYLRDMMNGYSLVKKHHPSYELPDYIV